jgi:hypothetical protein
MMLSFLLFLVYIFFVQGADNTNADLSVVFVTFKVPEDATAHQGLYWAGVPGERIADEKPYFGNSDAGTYIQINRAWRGSFLISLSIPAFTFPQSTW